MREHRTGNPDAAPGTAGAAGAAGSALHRDADRVLAAWSPPPSGEGQEALRAAYRDHLAAHPDGVWRECRAGHLTASALVIDPARERVLLTLHGKLHKWLQMGGHCEREDTTLASAALREAGEESGIAGLRLLPGGPVALDRHRTPCAWHLDVQYAVLAPRDAVERISEESLALRWFGYREAGEVADGSVRRLIAAARARL